MNNQFSNFSIKKTCCKSPVHSHETSFKQVLLLFVADLLWPVLRGGEPLQEVPDLHPDHHQDVLGQKAN